MQILAKCSTAALQPFHSRLFRRAHHSSRYARRWVVQNLSKAAIKGTHPRCELCSPNAPCLMPYWGYHLSARTFVPGHHAEGNPRCHPQRDTTESESSFPPEVTPQVMGSTVANVAEVKVGNRRDGNMLDSQQVDAMDKSRSARGPQALHLLCSLRSDSDQPRLKCSTCAPSAQKQHVSGALRLCSGGESWQMVPAEANTASPKQVCSSIVIRNFFPVCW